jgi:alpha-beta hydrolase superfamily lysophospholipase
MDSVFTTNDGLRLRARVDAPAGVPRAAVVLVHGIGDQVDGLPYATAAVALSARGFSVHRLELRGHGRSGGPPTFVESFDVFRDDLRGFVATVRSASAPPPRTFLVGVSMGGLIVTDYALHHAEDVTGVVAVAPALGETGGSRLLLALLPLLARVAPRLRLDPKLDLDKLTRDRAMLKAYVEDDPLYQRRITPRLAAEVIAAIGETRRRAGELRVPLLVLHGTADTVTSPAGSRSFVESAGVADKAYKGYDGALHNLFVETNREAVFDDIANWMAARS